MAIQHDLPATDSAAVLHQLVGDDATASFENDPKFIDSNPDASSDNLQTRADRQDLQSQPDLHVRAEDDEEEDDEDEEDEDDGDEEDEDYDEDEDDLDDEDEEDDDYDDDEEDDDEEDDEDE